MGLFPGWPIDHILFAIGTCFSLAKRSPLKTALEGWPAVAMGAIQFAYYAYFMGPGFIRGSTVVYTSLQKPRASTPFFSWKCYYCLCASESATTVICAAMFYDAGWLGPISAVCLATVANLAGYGKYLVQMWYDHDYVATSIFLYLFMFLTLAVLQQDPLYYILMCYPFMVLLKVPNYGNMRGRKILFDEESLILHCVDHLIHGSITCSVGIYHFFGLPAVLLTHLFVVPLGYFITEVMTKLQQGVSTENGKDK
jgi:hypothetical protein